LIASEVRTTQRFVKLFNIKNLPNDILGKWKDILARNPQLQSPFYSPCYCELISQCNQDVKIAVIFQGSKLEAIFAFEMEEEGKARPVGSIFCDYQGVISNDIPSFSPEFILKECGVEEWYFDHVPTWQSGFKPYATKSDVSWLVDIRNGFSHYANDLKKRKSSILADSARKKRKIEREVGAVVFHPHIIDHSLLNEMLTWKSYQWEKSGWKNRFKPLWEQKLMHGLLEENKDGFKGAFSVLEANGIPLAMHLGLQSNTVWHTWTTAYNPDYKRYSPGILKHLEMLKSCEHQGIRVMDFGKEDFLYKRRLHTHTLPLIEGRIKVN